ncbi:hypothetical protein K402DRAFT_388254 [Aulographum hederae CBS 113979]|uniref:Uncharacterized protein n=1 Tax=Aulographum hederae CBS 113979 TaxID=1176131 RepID=A0A6G1HH94_9PEZI|nr:hypothetical protein K402DRAFT_388254 [Aulographum hederae CBS 113979]
MNQTRLPSRAIVSPWPFPLSKKIRGTSHTSIRNANSPQQTPLPVPNHQPSLPPAAIATPPPVVPSPASGARNSPHPPSAHASQPLPSQPSAHGSNTRVYLNQNVTPHLLEGMKYLAAYEPEKPLRWLAEFLANRSREVEGQ